MKEENIIVVEGGGSKSKALLYNIENMSPVKYLTSFSINHHNVGINRASMILDELISMVREDHEVSHYIFGFAGLDSKYDYIAWNKYLSKHYDAYTLLHDVKLTLYAATYGDPGIIVIAGTGVNVYGYDGKIEWYSGNWGWKVGDEGSAYYIGREALNRVLRYIDGRGVETKLYKDILEALNLESKDDIINWIYGASPSEIASISRNVCNNYFGDDVAKEIIVDAVEKIVESIVAVANKIGFKYPINITGGVFKCQYFLELFKEKLNIHGLKMGKHINFPIIGGIVYYLKHYCNENNLDYYVNQMGANTAWV